MPLSSSLIFQLKPIDRVLDLATGTADVAIIEGDELLKKGASAASGQGYTQVLGVDPSVGMLEIGRAKVTERQLDSIITLVEGDAQNLRDLPDDTFDKISMSFGIRNVEDRTSVLREIWRVSAKNVETVVAIMDFSMPTSGILKPLAEIMVKYGAPALGSLVSGLKEEYLHLQRSIISFPPPQEFAKQMEENGLEVYEVKDVAFGVVQLYLAHPRISDEK